MCPIGGEPRVGFSAVSVMPGRKPTEAPRGLPRYVGDVERTTGGNSHHPW